MNTQLSRIPASLFAILAQPDYNRLRLFCIPTSFGAPTAASLSAFFLSKRSNLWPRGTRWALRMCWIVIAGCSPTVSVSVEVGFVTMAIGSFLHPQTGMDRQAQRCRAGSEGDEWLSEEHIKNREQHRWIWAPRVRSGSPLVCKEIYRAPSLQPVKSVYIAKKKKKTGQCLVYEPRWWTPCVAMAQGHHQGLLALVIGSHWALPQRGGGPMPWQPCAVTGTTPEKNPVDTFKAYLSHRNVFTTGW